MKINRAVITAAGRNHRALPLQHFVDRDGVEKTALAIIVEEIAGAAIDEIGIVICPGDEADYTAAAGEHSARLTFIEQAEPRGYGHALYCARDFVRDEPFLHLVSDHLYVSTAAKRCAAQLVGLARVEECSVSAVQPTLESKLPLYGAIGGRHDPQRTDLYEIDTVIEKPTPTEAEQKLFVPGLRSGHYLCMFGMHVLTPGLMDILAEQVAAAGGEQVQLSPALAQLAAREHYLATVLAGRRYNIGVKYGPLRAQLALALDGADRDRVLAQLVELLAERQLDA